MAGADIENSNGDEELWETNEHKRTAQEKSLWSVDLGTFTTHHWHYNTL
jgi:hypothetical protein